MHTTVTLFHDEDHGWGLGGDPHVAQDPLSTAPREDYRAMVQAWLRAARRERIVAKRTWRKERAALTRTADEATPSAQPRARKRL